MEPFTNFPDESDSAILLGVIATVGRLLVSGDLPLSARTAVRHSLESGDAVLKDAPDHELVDALALLAERVADAVDGSSRPAVVHPAAEKAPPPAIADRREDRSRVTPSVQRVVPAASPGVVA